MKYQNEIEVSGPMSYALARVIHDALKALGYAPIFGLDRDIYDVDIVRPADVKISITRRRSS